VTQEQDRLSPTRIEKNKVYREEKILEQEQVTGGKNEHRQQTLIGVLCLRAGRPVAATAQEHEQMKVFGRDDRAR
jgi:hypothetical protein